MTPTLWLAVLATVAMTLAWPALLASLDNKRHGKITVNPTPLSDISKLMMKGRIELYRWPDLLTWYDQQAELAGLRVIHPTNSTVTTEYVSSVK
jgi:hypothetical protein